MKNFNSSGIYVASVIYTKNLDAINHTIFIKFSLM